MTDTFFVTGTDTDVGKTAVAAGLLLVARKAGLRTAAIKPVAAGCDEQGHNEDALLLQRVITEPLLYEQVNPVALRESVAPHIAARREARTLRSSHLAGFCRGVMMGSADFVLVEGAGGWRVPLSGRETLAHLARELQCPVILVVAMRLGCINHALLTAEAIRADGLALAGWVANTPGAKMSCYRENLETLGELLAAPLLGEIPCLEDCSPEAVSQYLSLPALRSK